MSASKAGSRLLVAATLGAWLAAPQAKASDRWVTFESGPVRPLATSPSQDLVLVANIPDGYVEVLEATSTGLDYVRSIAVGLDPVSIAVRNDHEAWVVNHVSDSVSVVDYRRGVVLDTLQVGDEPRDVVFANGRAFITTAHRGQRRLSPELTGVTGSGDPMLTTPGVGRADVWVFDADARGGVPGGVPLRVVQLFGDTPRALAVSADGTTVYAAVFNSGNETTIVAEQAVCDGFESAAPCLVEGVQMPGGNPGPDTNDDGVRAPEVGLIVKYDRPSQRWLDELERDWTPAIRFSLPDYDVFAIDADNLEVASPPIAHVGTTLFNMAVNPVTGDLYVSNTDSHNEVRFEGPRGPDRSTVQGDLARSRITVLSEGNVLPRHLNRHIDYEQRPAEASTAKSSLALPLDMVVSSDGEAVFVAGFGSARVGVYSSAALLDDTFDPATVAAQSVDTSGGGPCGLALDESRGRLYVYTRFDNAVAVVSLDSLTEVEKLALPSPEPEFVRRGRSHLYDAASTSSNGEASCASCHVFGDMDHLAWDLGDPSGTLTTGSIPIRLPAAGGNGINGTGQQRDFHPMKGPMTTQSLRGLRDSGAQHWRGDRSVGEWGDDPMDAAVSFKNFIVAFEGLLGRSSPPAEGVMEEFTDFALSLSYPPNPVRSLDNTLTEDDLAAKEFYASPTRISDGIHVANLGFNCDGCHTLSPEQGLFGTGGLQAFSGGTQMFKVPQLRNLYQKVGMFGMSATPFIPESTFEHQGDQIRGFGFLHDGSVDTIVRFFHATTFTQTAPDIGFNSDLERQQMEQLMFAYDSDVAPVVGQDITVIAPDDRLSRARVEVLIAAAERSFASAALGGKVRECEVIAKAAGDERTRGFLYDPSRTSFTPDDGKRSIMLDELLARASTDSPVTFRAVVPNTGHQRGVDRDEDGRPDGIDLCPLDPVNNTPQTCDDLHRPVDVPGGTDGGTDGTTSAGDSGIDVDTKDGESGVEDAPGADVGSPSGCACRTGPSAPLGLSWMLATLGILRRRRSGPPASARQL